MMRPGKPEGPHYLAHQTMDTDHGVILDVAVMPGDANDSAPYLAQLERIHQNILPIRAATAGAAYDFPLAHQVLRASTGGSSNDQGGVWTGAFSV